MFCTNYMKRYRNRLYQKNGERIRWLVCGWLLLFMQAGVAAAAESGCADPASCTVVSSATWRDSIDKARNDLADKFMGLQLSAFGDVASYYDDAAKQKIDWGSFELDASAELGYDLQASFAAVNDKNGTTFPVGFLDYHTFGGRIAPRGRLWVEKGFHLQVGRFDVPFGSDWQFFASKDSVSISRPLTTEIIMDGGYNDKGMRILGNNGSVNFNAYLLQGFNAGRLVGGRLGLTPFSEPFSLATAKEPKTFELGLSYFYDADKSWKKNEIGYAADVEVFLDDWSGRFEYITRRKETLLAPEFSVLRGWHFTQEYLLDEDETNAWPTTFFVRYEQNTLEPPAIATLGSDAGDARDVRVAAGAKTNLGGSDVVQLKFEVQHYRSATPASREMPGFGRKLFLFTQLVIVL